jgi:hypothetical protein
MTASRTRFRNGIRSPGIQSAPTRNNARSFTTTIQAAGMAGAEPDGHLDMSRLPDQSNNLVYRMARKRRRSRRHHTRSKDGESSIPSRADTSREAAGSSRTLLTPVHPTTSSSS